ncbi:hypothetical protein LJ741_01945 [Streptomyces lydicus]|nr:hypothetical protein LJ741_01945 [Streptomyces lydicus]
MVDCEPAWWTLGVLGSRIFVNNATPGPQRNRVHVDVWVPYAQAEVRIAATLAAGGLLVNDTDAPSNWVLADPETNEACVGVAGPPDWPPTTRSPGPRSPPDAAHAGPRGSPRARSDSAVRRAHHRRRSAAAESGAQPTAGYASPAHRPPVPR